MRVQCTPETKLHLTFSACRRGSQEASVLTFARALMVSQMLPLDEAATTTVGSFGATARAEMPSPLLSVLSQVVEGRDGGEVQVRSKLIGTQSSLSLRLSQLYPSWL